MQNKKQNIDDETLKIPAFMRNKVIVSQAKQKLIWTALDRKEAGLSYKSRKPLARVKTEQKPITNIRREQPLIENKKQEKTKFKQIGVITSYIDKIQVAIIKLTGTLKKGDTILVEGKNYIFKQQVKEIQINRIPVSVAKKGDHIGIKIDLKPKQEGKIYI